MKRYKPFHFNESDIKIPLNTQEVIRRNSKNKKYISDSNTLKVSFDDILNIITNLKDELKQTKDKEKQVQIQKALEELNNK
jgi:hypothetical protein